MSREGLKLSLMDNSNTNNNGAPTLTTPTLTPTTLRNIEQMLLDSGDAPLLACEPPEPHENAAGFVPPSVEIPNESDYEGDKLQTTLDWVLTPPQNSGLESAQEQNPNYPPVPPVIASLIKDPSAAALPGPTNILLPLLSNLTPVSTVNNLPPSVSLPTVPCSIINDNRDNQNPVVSNNNVMTSMHNNNNNNNNVCPKKKNLGGGGRRINHDSSQLTPEEQLKRDLRRERNKEAAARCRKRRLDQTLTLQDEVDELDSKKLTLQKEFESLKVQRDELELLLKTHKAGYCSVVNGGIKKEPTEDNNALDIKREIESETSSVSALVSNQ